MTNITWGDNGPARMPTKEYKDNYDAIFGKKDTDMKENKCVQMDAEEVYLLKCLAYEAGKKAYGIFGITDIEECPTYEYDVERQDAWKMGWQYARWLVKRGGEAYSES